MTTLFNTSASNKPNPYKIQDFQYRFRKLQLLCHKLDLSGILIICGFDANNNEEYNKLVSWLFTGYAGTAVDDEVFLNSKFKDMIFLVYKDGAYCYAEPECFEIIEKYLLSIPNIKIYSPTPKETEQIDSLELTKIVQFYKMTRELTSVGVCLGREDEGKIVNIEKWPLLQAYALDDLGCGFFGLNHNPMDITEEVRRIYEDYDKYMISNLIANNIRQLENHINSTYFILDSFPIAKRYRLTEAQIAEVLWESYDFTILRKPSVGEFTDLPKPRVLIGTNTNADFSVLSSGEVDMSKMALSDRKAPLHFTLEYVDPLSKMRVARTYFTGLNEVTSVVLAQKKNEDEQLEGYLKTEVDNSHFNNEKLLLGYYTFTIKTARTIMESFANSIKDLNQEFAEKKVISEFNAIGIHKDQILVHLKCYNALGTEIKPNYYDSSPDLVNSNLCLLRIQINNIKGVAKDEILGSIVFCDSFYVQNGAYFNLTHEIPYFRSWTIDPTASESIERVKDIIICDEVGKPTSQAYENSYLHIPTTETFQSVNMNIHVQKCVIRLYEHAFKITTESWGNFYIFYSDIDTVELHRKTNRPGIAFNLKKKPLMNVLGADTFYVFLNGYAATEMFVGLGPILKEKNIEFKNVDEVSKEFEKSLPLFDSHILYEKYFKMSKIKNNHILDPITFLSFLEYQQILKITNQKDLTFKVFYKLTEPEDKTQVESESKKFSVYLINGTFASGKNKFADNLAKYSKTIGKKIHVYRKVHRELVKLNNKLFVDDFIKFVNNPELDKEDKILVVLPSMLNTKLIVDNITRMPEFTEKCELKTIVTKINLNNFYQDIHKEVCENFLTFCTAGYSQFIILDNYGADEKYVDMISSSLRYLFHHSEIYRINANIIQEGLAKEILNANNFDSKINKIERKRNIPFKAPDRKYVYIPFKVPVLKDKIAGYLYKEVLEKETGYFFDEEPVNIKHLSIKAGVVETDMIMLKEMIRKTNMIHGKEVPYIYCVKAVIRYEEALDEVHEITAHSNYFNDKKIEGIKGVINKTEVKGFEKIEISYDNFDAKDLGFLFYGENLNEERLNKLLQRLIKPPKSKLKLKTVEDLTPEQIWDLQIQYRGWGLEGGVLFDGARFREYDGTYLPGHPRKDEIIEMYLAEENGKIGSQNRLIEKEWKMIEQMWE